MCMEMFQSAGNVPTEGQHVFQDINSDGRIVLEPLLEGYFAELHHNNGTWNVEREELHTSTSKQLIYSTESSRRTEHKICNEHTNSSLVCATFSVAPYVHDTYMLHLHNLNSLFGRLLSFIHII